MSKIIPHCWMGNDEVVEWGSDAWAEAERHPATCMLEAGHKGPHEFIPHSEIEVTFSPEGTASDIGAADEPRPQSAGWRLLRGLCGWLKNAN